MRVRAHLRTIAGGCGVASSLFALAVTHFPAPSGVGATEADPSRVAVRGVWHTLGEWAHAAGRHGLRVPDVLASDKTIHVAIYLLPGVTWATFLALGRQLRARSALALFGVLAAWGAADELTQAVLGRDGDWADWAANLAGAGSGILAVLGARALWRRVR